MALQADIEHTDDVLEEIQASYLLRRKKKTLGIFQSIDFSLVIDVTTDIENRLRIAKDFTRWRKMRRFGDTSDNAKMKLATIAMQAEKSDTETEKNETGNDARATSVANEVTNLKIEDGSTSSTPSSPSSTQPGNFLTSFKAFSKFGDPKSDGKLITLSQSDKWMKQAKVIDGKKITTTDTGIYFKKHKSTKLNLEQYKAFLEELTKSKKVELTEIKKKMANCGPPGFTGGASGTGKAMSTVDRLTDVSKYTGSHKQRFDETGRGKGISGRKDLPDQSGYVQGYQNKDTYKAH